MYRTVTADAIAVLALAGMLTGGPLHAEAQALSQLFVEVLNYRPPNPAAGGLHDRSAAAR